MLQRVLVVLGVVALVACKTAGTGTSDPSTGFPDEGSGMPTAERSASAPDSARAGSGLQTIYFEFDQSTLGADARDLLRSNADYLKANATARVRIEGNCDDRGSAEYNLALGERRALAAKQYLVDLGIDSGRLATISYGEERPAVRGTSEAAYAKNRRDDFTPISR